MATKKQPGKKVAKKQSKERDLISAKMMEAVKEVVCTEEGLKKGEKVGFVLVRRTSDGESITGMTLSSHKMSDRDMIEIVEMVVDHLKGEYPAPILAATLLAMISK